MRSSNEGYFKIWEVMHAAGMAWEEEAKLCIDAQEKEGTGSCDEER